jgi:hypothetical protein
MILCITVISMIKLYPDRDRSIFQEKIKRIRKLLFIETLVFLFLVILFSCLMDYYFYLLYKIANIVLSIIYLFSLLFVYDNIIKPLKFNILLNKKINSNHFKSIQGVISSIDGLISKNYTRYRLLEIKVNERETKKVFLEEKYSLFNIGEEVVLYLVDNIIVAYGEVNA